MATIQSPVRPFSSATSLKLVATIASKEQQRFKTRSRPVGWSPQNLHVGRQHTTGTRTTSSFNIVQKYVHVNASTRDTIYLCTISPETDDLGRRNFLGPPTHNTLQLPRTTAPPPRPHEQKAQLLCRTLGILVGGVSRDLSVYCIMKRERVRASGALQEFIN